MEGEGERERFEFEKQKTFEFGHYVEGDGSCKINSSSWPKRAIYNSVQLANKWVVVVLFFLISTVLPNVCILTGIQRMYKETKHFCFTSCQYYFFAKVISIWGRVYVMK